MPSHDETLLGFETSLQFTLAAKDMDAAAALEDALIDVAEEMGWMFGGSTIAQMKPEDIMEGSPLDRALNGCDCERCS